MQYVHRGRTLFFFFFNSEKFEFDLHENNFVKIITKKFSPKIIFGNIISQKLNHEFLILDFQKTEKISVL